MESYNLNEIAGYFKSGCKKDSKNYLGLELEHFIVDRETGRNIDYFGEGGVEGILGEMVPFFDGTFISDGHIIGLDGKNMKITLEPGAQFEISITQQNRLSETARVYNDFISIMEPILSARNYEMVTMGYMPHSKVDELKIIPKARYRFMEAYFKNAGICGKNMMKGTAATQVSIDYGSEQEFIIKYRAASILAPVLAFMTDNSPIFEGNVYEKNMLRQYIWDNVDYGRPMTIPALDKQGFGFDRYAEFVYSIPQIILDDTEKSFPFINKNGNEFANKEKHLPRNIYDGKKIGRDDIELLLSMVFPDVRLKTYIEIRVADSMPIEFVISYMALLKGLFRDVKSLDALVSGLGPVKVSDIIKAKHELTDKGFKGNVYGRDPESLIVLMYELAQANLDGEEAGYLDALRDVVGNNKTLAQIYKSKMICGKKPVECGECYGN